MQYFYLFISLLFIYLVLIPLAITLVILIILVIFLVCRYSLWPIICKRKRRYREVSNGSSKFPGYQKMPSIETNKHPIQILSGEQYSKYRDLDSKDRSRGISHNKNYRHEKTQKDDLKEIFHYESESSGISEGSMNYSDIVPTSPSYPIPSSIHHSHHRTSSASVHEPQTKRLIRFMSEPALYETPHELKLTQANIKRRRYSHAVHKKRSSTSALSLVSPAGGQLEFGLYYNLELKTLDVTINQLCDLTLKPENFLGILEIFDSSEQLKDQSVYLKRNENGGFELSDSASIGFLIYLTLLPKGAYKKHTKVVFGTGNIVFNEKISITGYSTEHLSGLHLCFHILCKFGRDGAPVVLGEVKAPLKRIQVSKALPFMSNLAIPEEELELEVRINS